MTTNWQQRSLERLGAPAIDFSNVDRIEIHSINREFLKIDPSEPHTIGLSSLSRIDMGAMEARRRSLGRLYRAQTGQTLFPSDPASTPEHAIFASRMLEGENAQQLLSIWRTQTLDCDPEGFPLCHAPNFALSFYAGQARLFEVELCWYCQEARFFAGEKSHDCDFAVNTPAAHELRRILKHYFPEFRTEEDDAPAFFHNWQ
jgi:hypothetical protein